MRRLGPPILRGEGARLRSADVRSRSLPIAFAPAGGLLFGVHGVSAHSISVHTPVMAMVTVRQFGGSRLLSSVAGGSWLHRQTRRVARRR